MPHDTPLTLSGTTWLGPEFQVDAHALNAVETAARLTYERCIPDEGRGPLARLRTETRVRIAGWPS